MLAELIRVHKAFIEKKKAAAAAATAAAAAEREHIEWLIRVADEIDAARAAEHTEWLLYEAAIIDWKLLCFSDSGLD